MNCFTGYVYCVCETHKILMKRKITNSGRYRRKLVSCVVWIRGMRVEDILLPAAQRYTLMYLSTVNIAGSLDATRDLNVHWDVYKTQLKTRVEKSSFTAHDSRLRLKLYLSWGKSELQ